MIRVLMVCTGNICRSPTAEGVLRHQVRERGLERLFEIDSAGMISYHTGQPPDSRAMRTALMKGIDIRNQRARQINRIDFEDFDFLLAMDRGHLAELCDLAPQRTHPKISLLLAYLAEPDTLDVPDPYYGDTAGFQQAFALIQRGTLAFLKHLEDKGIG